MAGYGRDMTVTNLSGRDAVLAALTSDDLTVPPAPADEGPPSLAWLRAHVARFSEGPDHARRRGHAEAALAGTDPAHLRQAACRHTTGILATAGSTVDLMARVARTVPVRVLAEALGIADPAGTVPADVAVVARQYLTGPEQGESTGAADAAVGRLVGNVGEEGERAAAVVGLLVQSYEAAAGLIGNACLAALRGATTPRGADEAATVVAGMLRENPPVLGTRRLATVDAAVADVHIGAGEVVWVDLASAGMTFGTGHHGCPGADQARAIAAGVVDAIRGWRLVDETIGYVPSPNVRVPARLVITAG
jgi:cytochrome P450